MILVDMNKSWKAPDGYDFTGMSVEGSFVRLRFDAPTELRSTMNKWVEIYINDQGREVLRVIGADELSRPSVQVQDWSGTSPDHIQAPNAFIAYIKYYWKRFVTALANSGEDQGPSLT